jgi:Na+-transporting NADH:ubiquinone oxidoreductase subunit NqrF
MIDTIILIVIKKLKFLLEQFNNIKYMNINYFYHVILSDQYSKMI